MQLVKGARRAGVLLLQTVLGVVAGFACIAAGGGWIGGFIISFPFSALGVLIHELGHAGVADRVGWRVHRIMVCGLSYYPGGRKAKTSFRLPAGHRDLGGYVVAGPRKGEPTRRDDTLVTLGGPAANFVSAALFILLAQFLPGHLTMVSGAFGVFSIVLGLSSLVPWRVHGGASDGLQLWRMWLKPRRPGPPAADWLHRPPPVYRRKRDAG